MDARKKDMKSSLFDWADALVLSLVTIVAFFSLLGGINYVKGPSMESTLKEGDRLLISKVYLKIKRGDIVVVTKKSFQEEPIVKRVIAVAGQKVDIDFDEGIVYVNDAAIDEPYINNKTRVAGGVGFPVVVPKGCIFVMGDNRNVSKDSRYSDIGFIDTRQILGKAVFRVLPFGRFGLIH